MPTRVSDLHVVRTQVLPSPEELIAEVPRTPEQEIFVHARRQAIHDIIYGRDKRWLVVTGPCSIHDEAASLEYARRLAELQARLDEEFGAQLLIVMRVYFEKPRTTVGWKGLIMDPDLDGSADIPKGLRLARRILSKILDLGLATATEFLDPITPQYIADQICWAAIGARTTESQTHRQMASGLSMPIGFKNATCGAVDASINAIKAARQPQTFLGVDSKGRAAAVSTTGNPDAHLILRGGDNGPNHRPQHVEAARKALVKHGCPEAIIIDASHANCGKNHLNMPGVFREILAQRVAGDLSIVGAMLESNLLAGAQAFPCALDKLVDGQSITDPCIDWETNEELLREAAAALASVNG